MGEVTVGAHTYGLPLIRRGTHNSITIGKYCSIAQDVIWDGGFSHNYKNVTTYPFNPNWPGCGHLPLNLKQPINETIIGNDVWIGENAVIMAGVTIGDGAVIGMRTIVTGYIPPYSIWVGAPMKFLKFRFTREQIESLSSIAWWNWPDEKVRENLPLLLSENIDDFINKHYHE